MSLCLSCDVYVKRMPGVGPKSLGDIVKIRFLEFQKQCPHATLFPYLKKYLYSKVQGLDSDVVQTYIHALIYEPTNVTPDIPCQSTSYRTYLDNVPPPKLPRYLEEFAHETTAIYDGQEISYC